MYEDSDGNMPWWGNLLVGVGIIAALAVATVVTAGIAGVGVGAALSAGFTGASIGTGVSGAGVSIASGALAGSVIGSVTSGVASGIMTAVSGGDFNKIIESSCSSFMFGSVLGAFTGGVNACNFATNSTINTTIHMGLDSVASVGSYMGQTYYMNGNLDSISPAGLLLSAIGGASGGYNPSASLTSGCYNYISNQGAYFVDFLYKAKKGMV